MSAKPTYGWAFSLLAFCIILATYFRSSVFGMNQPPSTLCLVETNPPPLDTQDPYKCSALRETGSWLDRRLPDGTHRTLQKWQPQGCMIKNYNSKKLAQCLAGPEGKDAIFIGDSTLRQIFWATARKLNPVLAANEDKAADKHKDITFTEGSTTLNFIWDPYLNSSDSKEHLELARHRKPVGTPSQVPLGKALIVFGAGLWFAKNELDAVSSFKDAIDPIANLVDASDQLVKVPGRERIIFSPVQPPYYDRLDQEHVETILPQKVNAMNTHLTELATIHNLDLVSSFLDMTVGIPEAYQPNGLHVTDAIADRQAEIIINMRCNARDKGYPYSGTCCYDYPYDYAQLFMFLVGLIGLLMLGWVELQAWTNVESTGVSETIRTRLPILRAVLILWTVLVYCYVADRTQLFEKLLKQYNNQDFFVFCAVIVIAGFSTIQLSSTPQRPGQEKPPNQDQPFLSRDQTDEWKGWMQVLILAYHYTGASKVLWIYKIIRLLVASYLFMTGYGHAAYFYQKADFSLKRVAGVLVRLNLLSCLLPWAMHTDYLFYYFAPLVTYWYAIIFLTMFIKSDWNQKLPFFLGKIACSATITTFLHTQPGLLAPVFKVINFIFGSKWEAKEWLFRVGLDQYIVYIGMIVAVLYIRSSKPPSPPPPPQGGFASTSHTAPGRSPHLQNAAYMAASAAAIVVYAYASSTGTTKTTSNALHTYISPLPILAFIHLRNSTRLLRNHYSGIFAWVGRVSLETFVLQYHIWLAADTQGLLDIGLFGDGGMSTMGGLLGAGMGLSRWANCIILGVLFVWLSSKVAAATGTITASVIKAVF